MLFDYGIIYIASEGHAIRIYGKILIFLFAEYRKEQKSKKDAASERKKKVKEEEKLPHECIMLRTFILPDKLWPSISSHFMN
jgi:hypothetical protein